MLKEKNLEIDGVEYVVRELRIGDAIPLMAKMQDVAKAPEAQLAMVEQCLFVNGKPIGEGAADLGLQTYMKIVDAVMDLNGLRDSGKD